MPNTLTKGEQFELPPDGYYRYSAVRERVEALSFDEQLVLLCVALDPTPRPIRTSAILTENSKELGSSLPLDAATVKKHYDALTEAGFLVQPDRQLIFDPEAVLNAAMCAYTRHANAGKKMAQTLLRMTGYQSKAERKKNPNYKGPRSWDFAFDYDTFPRKTWLLLFANQYDYWQEELNEIRLYHEWRVPARKAEAILLSKEPLQTFDYTFWQTLDPSFRLAALNTTLGKKAVWKSGTDNNLAACLTDPELSGIRITAYDEAIMSFGASLTMHTLGSSIDQLSHAVGVKLLASACYQHEAQLQEALEAYPISYHDEIGLADIVAELLRLRENKEHRHTALARSKQWRKGPFMAAIDAAKAYLNFRVGNVDLCEQLLRKHFSPIRTELLPRAKKEGEEESDQPKKKVPEFAAHVSWMVGLWTYAWTGLKPHPLAIDALIDSLEGSTEDSQVVPIAFQPYLRGEILNALAQILPGDPRVERWKSEALGVATQYGFTYLLTLHSVPEAWEYTLRVLDTIAGTTPSTPKETVADTRLIWIVDFDRGQLLPREQKRGKRGWSKGRILTVQEMVEASGTGRFDQFDDRAIGSALRHGDKPVNLGQRYGADVRLDFGRALYHLNGHPRVFIDDEKRIPLEIHQGQAQLIIDEDGGDLHLSFTPPGAHRPGYHYEKLTPTRYRVFEISTEQARLARAVGKETVIPASERLQIEQKVDALRQHVDVSSTTDLQENELDEIIGDARPCAQLLPYGVAYKLELYARPLPKHELYYRIGQGVSRKVIDNPDVLAEADLGMTIPDESSKLEQDQKIVLRRYLQDEVTQAENMIRDCPTLNELVHSNYEWTLDDDYTALRVLLELRSLQKEGRISIEHPKGEKIRLVGTSSSDDMRLQITKKRDWFEVSGSVTTDEGSVVSFRQLLAHLRNGGGDFVKLSEGEFMAITNELRSRLEAMEGMLHERNGNFELPPLAAGAFAELAEDLEDLELDDAWRENLERIKESEDFDPQLPPAFNGSLRDYQVTGYRWLRRLAEWGVGGCLADDMGLGKTVQALALLVSRASKGPALVIAPASVTRNWKKETERFAPSLSAKLLATSGDVKLLESLDKGDVLLVSYGLLTFIEEALLASAFSTIILDEAQAIKNPATKRAKLIFKLDAELRVATTGTPIENHLGELWSLFRFINPGLLGSRQAFNEKYAGPIRRENNKQRAEALRNLVRPFILRRRKEEVLKELPPKTEVNLSVQLSDKEMALYEALRREAVEAIDDASPNAQRMIVLQQLTRLRQAACHPKLVRPQSTLPSSKLELVGQTVAELVETGHKALIFSQFVKHLRLVEAWVQAAGLRYCYLDGSTPGKKRQKQVELFQNGEADVFLISLKAGGTGLNLTEADFVLHLDPWWNPAAEDQASDRAHRIGQQRPVTVYRFVSAGTIEERILELHGEKRDLADQILQGTDAGGRLSVGEVVDLLRSEPTFEPDPLDLDLE